MTIIQLRETIRPQWVDQSDLDWLTAAMPTHRHSLADPDAMDDVGRELTSGLHAVTTPSGRRWLAATDLYRIHAIELNERTLLPSGSYQLDTNGQWTRYTARISADGLIPYLATVEHEDPVVQLNLSARLLGHIRAHQDDHPNLVVFLANWKVQLHRSVKDLDLVEALDARPVISRAASRSQVAIQWGVFRAAVESGMTRWSGEGGIGPWRCAQDRRLAVCLGINVSPPALEATG